REAREVRNNTGAVCGDAGRGGFARGRGGRGGGEDADSARVRERAPRQPFGGGRRGGYGGRGGYGNGEAGEDSERPLRRIYEWWSGTGRGNWGSFTDGVLTSEANKDDKEGATNEMEEEDRVSASVQKNNYLTILRFDGEHVILSFSFSLMTILPWQSMPITEFLKPAEGERHCSAGGRGQYGGGFDGGGISIFPTAAPSIEDPGQLLPYSFLVGSKRG
ncbi:hypothetical protein BHM03_00002721, partial [Ensete ventricosum]